jgi:hypothetical protein
MATAAPAPAPPFVSLLARYSPPFINDAALALVNARRSADNRAGNWGECFACGGLTPGRLCGSCATQKPQLDAAAAIFTPKAVTAVLESQDVEDEHTAVLRLPDHLSRRAREVAGAIARITTRRLEAGFSLRVALRTASLGRDKILQELRAAGKPMDRKTVAYLLVELTEAGVLSRTGQMPAWTDPAEQDGSRVIKSGAFLFALAVELRTLGQQPLAALISHSSAVFPLGGKRGHARAEGALTWAVKHAQKGSRNRIGHWLACRCRDAALHEDDAASILQRYVARVDQGGHRYDLGEATRTLASVYRATGLGRQASRPSRAASVLHVAFDRPQIT